MAILANGQPTLADVAAQISDNGSALPIAELLHKTNPAMNDIPFEEANSTTGNKITARQKLPETYLRRINQGILPSSSGYGSILEAAGLFNALGQVDSKLVQLAVDKAKFRFNENAGHIESMGQRFFQSMLYGDPDVTPEDFLGIAPRYDSLTATARTSVQIIDAGGSGADLTSVYLVGWGERSVMGFYPMGTSAGIMHKALPESMIDDGTGKKYLGFEDWFDLSAGLAVYDYRNIVRIANIDISDLQSGDPVAGITAGAKLVNLFTMAAEMLNNPNGLNPVFYVPRVVSTFLRLQINNQANVWMNMKEVAGQKVVAFDGMPVRRMDAIALNETRVIV